MKILWFSHSAEVGGAEFSLLEAARGLVAVGHTVHVVLPARGPLTDRLEREGVCTSMVPYRWWIAAGAQRAPIYRARRLVRNVAAWPQIRRLLVRERPDLVVSNTLDIPAGALAARSLGLPHTWYVHELFGAEGHHLYFDYGERLSLALLDWLAERILVCSHAVQAQLRRGISPDKIRVVYQAVEVPRQPVTTERRHGAFRLAAVGRITSGKRQIDAVQALSLLVMRGLDVRLALIGGEEPEYGASLRSTIHELEVADRVEFVPFTEDPFSHVREADAVLVCSRGESFGRVTVEAMKLGKPVVGADSAGTSELIRDGWNGHLFRLGDPDDLAAKIAALYHDRDASEAMGLRASTWAQDQFNRARYTAALLEQFEEILGSRDGRVNDNAGDGSIATPHAQVEDVPS